jgi:hypothetical protein
MGVFFTTKRSRRFSANNPVDEPGDPSLLCRRAEPTAPLPSSLDRNGNVNADERESLISTRTLARGFEENEPKIFHLGGMFGAPLDGQFIYIE